MTSRITNFLTATAVSTAMAVTGAQAGEVRVGDHIFQTETLSHKDTQDLCIAARSNFEGAGSLARSAKILLERLRTDGKVSLREFRTKSAEYKGIIEDAIAYQESNYAAMGTLAARATETVNTGKGEVAPGTCDTRSLTPETRPTGP